MSTSLRLSAGLICSSGMSRILTEISGYMRRNRAMIGGDGGGKHDGCGNRHLATFQRGIVAHIADSKLRSFGIFRACGEIPLADEGERDHARVPVEQAHADFRFQVADENADRRLGGEGCGRPGERPSSATAMKALSCRR